MIKLSERTRRGLQEAIGIPVTLGGFVLAFIIIAEAVGGTMA